MREARRIKNTANIAAVAYEHGAFATTLMQSLVQQIMSSNQ